MKSLVYFIRNSKQLTDIKCNSNDYGSSVNQTQSKFYLIKMKYNEGCFQFCISHTFHTNYPLIKQHSSPYGPSQNHIDKNQRNIVSLNSKKFKFINPNQSTPKAKCTLSNTQSSKQKSVDLIKHPYIPRYSLNQTSQEYNQASIVNDKNPKSIKLGKKYNQQQIKRQQLLRQCRQNRFDSKNNSVQYIKLRRLKSSPIKNPQVDRNTIYHGKDTHEKITKIQLLNNQKYFTQYSTPNSQRISRNQYKSQPKISNHNHLTLNLIHNPQTISPGNNQSQLRKFINNQTVNQLNCNINSPYTKLKCHQISLIRNAKNQQNIQLKPNVSKIIFKPSTQSNNNVKFYQNYQKKKIPHNQLKLQRNYTSQKVITKKLSINSMGYQTTLLKDIYVKAEKLIGIGRYCNNYICYLMPIGFIYVSKEIPIITMKINTLQYKINKALEISSRMSHPNIIQVFYANPTSSKYIIAMEYGSNNLENQLKKDGGKFSQQKATQILHQLLIGLSYLHNYAGEGFVSSALKPTNIIFVNGVPKLQWLGYQDSVISPFMSPQLKRGNQPSKKTDIWSLGVIGYLMVYGSTISDKSYSDVLGDDKCQKKTDHKVTKEYRDFLLKALSQNQINRMNTAQCLAHPLFKRINYTDKNISV